MCRRRRGGVPWTGACLTVISLSSFFFFNDTATTEIYTLSLHDALPIRAAALLGFDVERQAFVATATAVALIVDGADRKSTRLNSSHMSISYAVFCLKKKKKKYTILLNKKKKKNKIKLKK